MAHRRRIVLALGAALLVPLRPARAEGPRPSRIGFLGNSTPALEANLVGPFRAGLREHGYVEGRDVAIEYRWAEGDYARFPRLVRELVAAQVDVIVTAGTPAALAVRRVAPEVPLVMVAVGDPVGTGLAASLAHPGGNATGLASIAPDLEGKRLQLLREVVPALARVAILMNPANAFHARAEREARAAAAVLGLAVEAVEVTAAPELDRAFATLARDRPDAFIMLADRVFLHSRARIVEFAARQRLPGVYAYRELVDAGGLMSFGPDYADLHRRAADYVDKILRGARAGELPIELPATFELVINLRTARALGLAIPTSVLLRADEVLQ